MPYAKIEPIEKVCPNCGKRFLVGGRGRPPKEQVHCSRRCNMLARPPIENSGSHAPRPRKYKDTLHDEAWLRQRYLLDELSSTEIGLLIGAPRATVKWALNKFGISMRTSSETKVGVFNRRGRKVATKAEMVAAYGGACECCGERELAFLSLDHRHGGGSAERKLMGGQQQLLNRLKADGWPVEDYRVLCMNCQFGARYGRTCPHQVDRSAEVQGGLE